MGKISSYGTKREKGERLIPGAGLLKQLNSDEKGLESVTPDMILETSSAPNPLLFIMGGYQFIVEAYLKSMGKI